jgi:hypothetical protein
VVSNKIIWPVDCPLRWLETAHDHLWPDSSRSRSV